MSQRPTPPPPPGGPPPNPPPDPNALPHHVIVEQKGPVKVGGCFAFLVLLVFVAVVFAVCVAASS